jgi:hypothetical protein
VRFDEDAARDGSHRFIRYGDVCSTPQAGRALLLRALNEDLLPDLVVIDHVLATGALESAPRVPAGLTLMRWITTTFTGRATVPPCVLWTAEYEPGLAHAFMEAGGAHAFGRDVPAAEFVGCLRSVADGSSRWQHEWTPPRLELTPAQRRVLPYFEANLPTHEIAARMRATGEIRVDAKQAEAWVNDRRREIMTRANKLCMVTGEAPFVGRGLSVALARFAQRHGNIWTPIAYRE